jgi:aldehyde:ferredoxin oxidoreductase
MRATTVGPEIISRSMSPHTLAGKVQYCITKQNAKAVKFSAVFCDFWAVTSEQLRRLFGHLQQRAFTDEEVLEIGERVWNLGRMFNLREGVESDDIPAALYERVTPSEDMPAEPIGRTAFLSSLREYYELRDWSEEGIPSEAKLAALGIDVRLPQGGSLYTHQLPRAT